jgi:uncharacterized membrane protein YccC
MPRERVLDRMRGDSFLGVHLAVNIFIGSTLLWLLLRVVAGLNPIWAIASLVAASDPQVKQAFANLRARLLNSLFGCVVGLAFLAVGGASEWKLPFAMAAAALVSTYIVRVPTMWRQCPITAALVVASSLTQHSGMTGAETGLRRVGEIILGCLFGVAVSWLMSKLWHVPGEMKQAKA